MCAEVEWLCPGCFAQTGDKTALQCSLRGRYATNSKHRDVNRCARFRKERLFLYGDRMLGFTCYTEWCPHNPGAQASRWEKIVNWVDTAEDDIENLEDVKDFFSHGEVNGLAKCVLVGGSGWTPSKLEAEVTDESENERNLGKPPERQALPGPDDSGKPNKEAELNHRKRKPSSSMDSSDPEHAAKRGPQPSSSCAEGSVGKPWNPENL
jgi:hypothetical protein